mmetsp:Transcript_32642/g.68952  ORF Transcript_32642/g.68952 Transcript_32642/m.68952 type:complete len:281 (-) Transcript_32642:545-1387(-)
MPFRHAQARLLMTTTQIKIRLFFEGCGRRGGRNGPRARRSRRDRSLLAPPQIERRRKFPFAILSRRRAATAAQIGKILHRGRLLHPGEASGTPSQARLGVVAAADAATAAEAVAGRNVGDHPKERLLSLQSNGLVAVLGIKRRQHQRGRRRSALLRLSRERTSLRDRQCQREIVRQHLLKVIVGIAAFGNRLEVGRLQERRRSGGPVSLGGIYHAPRVKFAKERHGALVFLLLFRGRQCRLAVERGLGRWKKGGGGGEGYPVSFLCVDCHDSKIVFLLTT